MFTDSFEKKAGPINRRISAAGIKLGLPVGIVKAHKDNVAKEIVDTRNYLREAGEGSAKIAPSIRVGSLSKSNTNKMYGSNKELKTQLTVFRKGKTRG